MQPMDRTTFEGWVKFAASNLYDYAALEIHPLTDVLIHLPPGYQGSRRDYIFQLFSEAIEKLRPPMREENPALPEWRPYFILRQRYLQNTPLPALTAQLAISDRQLRRDHRRALQALSSTLWSMLTPAEVAPALQADNSNIEQFSVHPELIDLQEVLKGVLSMIQHRVEEMGMEISLEEGERSVLIKTDRVILRQILISLFTHALHSSSHSPIRVSLVTGGQEVEVRIEYEFQATGKTGEKTLEKVGNWAQRISARLESEEKPLAEHGSNASRLALFLPRRKPRIVMVVDDQEPTIDLFRRYLARTDLEVVGVTHGDQVLDVAARIQPVVISLDVMMPQMDGWEVLQALKLNQATKHIPVVICSAWEASELALSLGAVEFIKKPVTQKDFLATLGRLNLLSDVGLG